MERDIDGQLEKQMIGGSWDGQTDRKWKSLKEIVIVTPWLFPKSNH